MYIFPGSQRPLKYSKLKLLIVNPHYNNSLYENTIQTCSAWTSSNDMYIFIYLYIYIYIERERERHAIGVFARWCSYTQTLASVTYLGISIYKVEDDFC